NRVWSESVQRHTSAADALEKGRGYGSAKEKKEVETTPLARPTEVPLSLFAFNPSLVLLSLSICRALTRSQRSKSTTAKGNGNGNGGNGNRKKETTSMGPESTRPAARQIHTRARFVSLSLSLSLSLSDST